MNHEHYVINAKKVDNLKIAARPRLAPDQPFLIIHSERIRLSSMVDDEFGFFRLDVVLVNLGAIPLDPSELVGHIKTSSRR
jgi:hypothetical protein